MGLKFQVVWVFLNGLVRNFSLTIFCVSNYEEVTCIRLVNELS